MVKIEIEVDELEYEKLIEKFMPMVGESVQRKHVILGKIISGKASSSAVSSMVARMPRKKKDKYVAKLINKNDTKIIDAIRTKASEGGFDFSIKKLKATAK